MTCKDFQLQISKLQDDELPREEMGRLFSHVGECSDCRNFFAGLRSLSRAIQDSKEAMPPEDIRPNTINPHRRTAHQKFATRKIVLRRPLAAVLLVALVVSLVLALKAGLSPRPSETIYLMKLPPVVVTAEGTAN